MLRQVPRDSGAEQLLVARRRPNDTLEHALKRYVASCGLDACYRNAVTRDLDDFSGVYLIEDVGQLRLESGGRHSSHVLIIAEGSDRLPAARSRMAP